jgi:hypothetical protein
MEVQNHIEDKLDNQSDRKYEELFPRLVSRWKNQTLKESNYRQQILRDLAQLLSEITISPSKY